MAERICSVPGCGPANRITRGLCSTHYARLLRGNDMTKPVRVLGKPELRFAKFIDKDSKPGCWLWTGYCGPQGYGRFGVDGRVVQAHRWVYEHFIGPIPDGLHLDHLCRTPPCVNPAHLEPVTCRENILRGTSPSAKKAAQTHCKRGHEFTAENTYHSKAGGRNCRECHRTYQRQYKRIPGSNKRERRPIHGQ